MVQKLASVAVEDGLCDRPDLSRLVALGSGGAYPGNTRRDFMRTVAPEVSLPEPVLVQVLVVAPHGAERVVKWIDHPVHLPHKLFLALQEQFPAHFQTLIGGNGVVLNGFWDNTDIAAPHLRESPAHALPDASSKCVPIVLHGDGAAYTTNLDSMTAVSWSTVLATGSVWESAFLISCWPKQCRAVQALDGADTWQTIWSCVRESFALAVEIGRQQPNTYIPIPCPFCADMEYRANDLGLPHWSNEQPCSCCTDCRSGEPSVRDLTRSVAWKATPATAPPALSTHQVFRLPGVGPFVLPV